MAWFSGPGSPSPSRRSYNRQSSSYSHHGSSSYYKRRPRDGFVQRMIHQIKHYMREIYRYARRHPVKVFFLVIMPLITGGALGKIFKQFGIRLPRGLTDSLGVFDTRKGGRSLMKGFGDSGSGGGGGIQSMMKIAQMFI